MRSCTVCLLEKPLDKFYVVSQLSNRYRPACKACTDAASNKYTKQNKMRVNEYKKLWAATHKDSVKATAKRRDKNTLRAHLANRRARQINATPSWLSDAHKLAIKLIYGLCPDNMQVDHVLPLRGKDVCGLHVPWNLQYLTPTENLKKGNRV